LVLALALLSGLAAGPADAQPRRRAGARKATAAKRVRPAPPPAPARQADPARAEESAAAPETVAPSDPAPAASTAKASKPRVYTFGGLDVEGKLKAPQLLYFRSRMRQELETSSDERRSFLKELEKTADEKGL
jgi:hypothetical protein